jgi:hypothetical protein
MFIVEISHLKNVRCDHQEHERKSLSLSKSEVGRERFASHLEFSRTPSKPGTILRHCPMMVRGNVNVRSLELDAFSVDREGDTEEIFTGANELPKLEED